MLKCLLSVALCAITLTAGAQTGSAYIKLVVPFAAGNAVDAAARSLAGLVSEDIGKTIVVENRVGASGSIAAAGLATGREPNTFLFVTTAMMTATPYLMKVAYAPSDFTPIARVATLSTIVAVPSDFPAKTWGDFVSLAKKAPGKHSFGSTGLGTITHLGMEVLQQDAGIKLLHIPYKDTGAAVQDFLGRRIDVYTEPSVIQFIQSGAARGLAVMGEKRVPEIPDVPTLKELGVNFDAQAWFGIASPKSMDAHLVQTMEAALKKAVARPEFGAKLPPGVQAGFAGSTAFKSQIEREQLVYKDLIARLQLKIE